KPATFSANTVISKLFFAAYAPFVIVAVNVTWTLSAPADGLVTTPVVEITARLDDSQLIFTPLAPAVGSDKLAMMPLVSPRSISFFTVSTSCLSVWLIVLLPQTAMPFPDKAVNVRLYLSVARSH